MAESTWISVPALAWAFDDAPVPNELLTTLLAVARYTDEEGKGARPSMATIARVAGKSPNQARADIRRLEELELIRPGDQNLAAHLKHGQRPVVYDVNLDLKGSRPVRDRRGGRRATETPIAHSGGTSHVDSGGTPNADSAGPPMPALAKESRENPDEESSSILPAPPPAERAPERALKGAEDEDEIEPQNPPAQRDLTALLASVNRRHLQSADKPHRIKTECGRCNNTKVLRVPVTEADPYGFRYCPECMVVPGRAEGAA